MTPSLSAAVSGRENDEIVTATDTNSTKPPRRLLPLNPDYQARVEKLQRVKHQKSRFGTAPDPAIMHIASDEYYLRMRDLQG